MSTPLSKEDYPKLQKLLEAIGMDPMCEPFLFPVQWQGKWISIYSYVYVELGLLDYPKVIQHPMDFDTLKQNMYAGKFSSYEEFLLEFQVIWDNCKLYNR